MGFFTKKNFFYKMIICLCIVLAVVNCSGAPKSYAATSDGYGMLLSPICDLLMGLSDGLMNILQKAIMGSEATLSLDNTTKRDWGAIALWAVVALVAFVATVITAGGVWAALGPILVTAAKVALIYGAICLATGGAAHTVLTSVAADALSDTVVLPTFAIGPEEIFAGRVLLFDANIFNPKQVYVEYNIVDGTEVQGSGTVKLEQWNSTYKIDSKYQPKRFYYKEGTEEIETSINNSAYELRNVISKWYYIIRNIALVASMLILLYVGIRIMISSIAEDKAKYKQMLADWVIAFCLIFMMHFIMVFAHNIVESVTDLFSKTVETGTHLVTIEGVEPGSSLAESVEDINSDYYDDAEKRIKWPTNLMGRIRVEAQNKNGTVEYVGFSLAYLVLVIYTATFAFTYIKRLLYLMFLTVIAPFVALTYPIDKMHDGKAQAFDMWIKEYIFNLAIQPFHLLLYTIFISMAFELASTNIIYTLVVLGFMMPAEKFLRNMFGFNKASTPGMLGGAAGAALAMSAVSSLGKFAKGGHGGGKDAGGNEKGKDNPGKIRMPDSQHSQQKLFEGLADSKGETGKNPAGKEQKMPTIEEKQRLASERSILEEFEEEGALDEGKWTQEDYDAYQELEREQLEQEAKLKEREENETVRQQEISEEQGNEQIEGEPSGAHVVNPTPISDTSSTSTETKNTRKPKYAHHFWGAVGNYAGKKLKKHGGKPLRLLSQATLGLAGGMIGAAAGIASGDPNAVFKNTTLGAGTGTAVATGVANRISGDINKTSRTIKEDKEQWEKDYYGEDYKKYLSDKQDEEFMKDKDIRKMYKQQLGLKNKNEVDTVMKEAKQYRAYGINDNSTIIKAMKSKNARSSNRADRERIAAAKLAEQSKTEKDLQTNMKRFREVPGMSKTQAERMERLVREINNL